MRLQAHTPTHTQALTCVLWPCLWCRHPAVHAASAVSKANHSWVSKTHQRATPRPQGGIVLFTTQDPVLLC